MCCRLWGRRWRSIISSETPLTKSLSFASATLPTPSASSSTTSYARRPFSPQIIPFLLFIFIFNSKYDRLLPELCSKWCVRIYCFSIPSCINRREMYRSSRRWRWWMRPRRSFEFISSTSILHICPPLCSSSMLNTWKWIAGTPNPSLLNLAFRLYLISSIWYGCPLSYHKFLLWMKLVRLCVILLLQLCFDSYGQWQQTKENGLDVYIVKQRCLC